MQLARILLAALAAVSLSPEARAQGDYPNKSIQVIVPFAAGGPVTVAARLMAEEMQKQLGQPFVIVNREGASGTLGTRAVLTAPKDGYVIGFGPSGPMISLPNLRSNVGYVASDLDYICQVFENLLVIAVPKSSRFQDFKSLLDYARDNPEKLNYGHPGLGSIPHLMGIELKEKLPATPVGFFGDGQTATALLQGTVDFGITGAQAVITNESLKALVVFSAAPLPALPNVPLGRNFGIDLALVTPGGFYGPKGLPEPTRRALQKACASAAAAPLTKQRFSQIGYGSPAFLEGDQFGARVLKESASIKSIIDRNNLKQ